MSLQKDDIGASHIEFNETGFLQLFGEELIFPIVKGMRDEILLSAPLFNGEAALALLLNETVPFKFFGF